MRKTVLMFIYIISFVLVLNTEAAEFNPDNLISDRDFVNINDMNVEDIQKFLDSIGGILKDYSENGRSAAQIIYDASHGYGDAAGVSFDGIIEINASTGTVNPKVLLVTLQKEQGLITRTDYSQHSFDWAAGYGYSDSCLLYVGFTKQVENAAWQLRYNYERAQDNDMVGYQVGDNVHLYNTLPNPFGGSSEQDVHLENRATASLYRYTPQVYNGNYNFYRLYNKWFGQN